MSNRYFSDLVEQSVNRAAESSLSILGISNAPLRQHLSEQMRAECGEDSAFLAPPLFEHTFGWESAELEMSQLSGNMLSNAVVDALDSEDNGRYRFNKSFFPHKHQLASWKVLLGDSPQSVVVTSGTGSGKTECFMVPVLEDLYREARQKKEPLQGVRALFLYPLNALINSQRERLNAWTQHFGGDIRFCLYNGNTEEKAASVRTQQKKYPNEVLSRELMRKEPAPVLVTNGTMLEYMLVRQVDAPIITKSREERSLRWIVLDEAHTYIGSQAAELSLQLRRVLHAFGVEAKDVRFVATSATIADENANDQLRKYLASLAGVPENYVHVIGGQRSIPEIPKADYVTTSYEYLSAIDEEEEVSKDRFDALSSSDFAVALRTYFVNAKSPVDLNTLIQAFSGKYSVGTISQDQMLLWIDLLTGTKRCNSSEAFLKVRAHFFQRMVDGLWSCINSACSSKAEGLKDSWPFGQVYARERQVCDCGSKVYEIANCHECNEPHLLATMTSQNSLIQWSQESEDEFSLQVEIEKESDGSKDTGTSYKQSAVIAPTKNIEDGFIPLNIDPLTGELVDGDEQLTINALIDTPPVCSKCGYGGYGTGNALRRAKLGSPFFVSNVVPTMLEYCPDPEIDKETGLGPQSLPGRGRKLITFTDSRQGTARMAVRMQQEAERSRLRGLVFEILREIQQSQPQHDIPDEGASPEELKEMISKLKAMGLDGNAQDLEKKLAILEGNNERVDLCELSWSGLVGKLVEKQDIQNSILLYNKYANPEIFDSTSGPRKLAEILLIREFMRRPKRQNSLETQGLIKVGYKGLDRVNSIPEGWASYGLTIDDWQSFLKVCLDFYIRENSYIKLEQDWGRWIGMRFAIKKLRSPRSKEQDENRVKKWPQYTGGQGNRLVKLLVKGGGLSLQKSVDQDQINSWLRAAWDELTDKKILRSEGNQFFLDREVLTFSFITQVYECPITNKLFDTVFKGLSPYLPRNYMDQGVEVKCTAKPYPALWQFDASQEDYRDGIQKIRQKVRNDDSILQLRSQNLWTDINDRTVEGGFYYRTAEHSAQQSADRLINYEKQFQDGKINVLNCSTTMEMGVDIGGISAVVMNNVPPHPANYLQRAGRAGRSKESRAISYTLCKSNPHDLQVFDNPAWPFTTKITAPHISLNSERLVQRHVNSLLLSTFLKSEVGVTQQDRTKLNLEWFYGAFPESISDRFLSWLKSSNENVSDSIQNLVLGTALHSKPTETIINSTAYKLECLRDDWLAERDKLEEQLKKAKKDGPFAFRVSQELKRLNGEYLLRELAAKSFIPGYGFPTDVVSLDTLNIEDYIRDQKSKKSKKAEREDNISRLRGLPSRNLSIAIKEYAPGAELVVDGRVFKVAGVSLNWQQFGNPQANEAQKFDVAWRCNQCGSTGVHQGIALDKLCCESCGAEISDTDKLKVLEPNGFFTDFYEAPTNDVTHQKFIPVQKAWVSANGERVSLPNPAMGFMSFSPDGHVFHHSAGENGEGYALCMKCGRADSMLPDGEFPDSLRPDKPHRMVRSSPKDSQGTENRFECDGSSTLQSNVMLGSNINTDVFELVLRNPVTQEYIYSSQEGEALATVLAVAFRIAVAESIGVSPSEMGYGIKQVKIPESQIPVYAIQIFDVISGGAGFATSAALHIELALNKMYGQLHCKADCDSACSHCLLDADTRHDAQMLNRHVALQWLSNSFKLHVGLPDSMQLIEGAKYYHQNLRQALQHDVNNGSQTIIIKLHKDNELWDLSNQIFRKSLGQYLFQDNINVVLVLPESSLNEELQLELLQLEQWGVELAVQESGSQNNFIAAQTVSTEGLVNTFAMLDSRCSIPGIEWLSNEAGSVLCQSQLEPLLDTGKLDTRSWIKAKDSNVAYSISSELNGSVYEFGQRFVSKLKSESPFIQSAVESGSIKRIHYSDRYLQSPWTLLLMSSVINALRNGHDPDVEIDMLFVDKDREGRCVFHDWNTEDDLQAVYDTWFNEGMGVQFSLKIIKNRSLIPHRRSLTLHLDDDSSVEIRLDQGFGYWVMDTERWNTRLRFFDFNAEPDQQMMSLLQVFKDGRVCNSADWKTDIYLVES